MIEVDRETGIPANLRKKEPDGSDAQEMIDGHPHFHLDPEKIRNIGLIVVYEGSVDWQGAGN